MSESGKLILAKCKRTIVIQQRTGLLKTSGVVHGAECVLLNQGLQSLHYGRKWTSHSIYLYQITKLYFSEAL